MMIYPSRTKLEEIAQNQVDEIRRLKEINADLLAALKEIEKGEGAFSLDPLTFASNAIENMKGIATAAIAKAEGER